MNDEREIVYAFIDSQNLNLSIYKNIFRHGKCIYRGWSLDFNRFFIYLKDKYRVNKVFLFIGYVPQYEHLYNELESFGYQIIYKPTLIYRDGNEEKIKGNVDAELVLHSMIEFPNYSKAIIVAGDGDYHCLIEYLEQHNKLGYILIPNRYNYSFLLGKFKKYIYFVTDLRGKLEKR